MSVYKEYCPNCADRVGVDHSGDMMKCTSCKQVLGKVHPFQTHMPECVDYSHDKGESPKEKSLETGYMNDINKSMGPDTKQKLPDDCDGM